MPPTAPFSTLEDICNAARVKLNDAIIPGGDVLTDNQQFTILYVNLAWQQFQQESNAAGLVSLDDEVIILDLAAVANTDPGTQTSLSWTGYNNGGGPDTSKVLPQTLIEPEIMWERPNGSNGDYIEMDRILNGLPAEAPGFFIKKWEWRNNAIYMNGATQDTDVRIRFSSYFPDFVPASTTAFASQPVPIMRCEDAFSGFVAYQMSTSRGDIDSSTLLTNAKAATGILAGNDSITDRSTQKTSERGKMRDRYTPQGPAGAE